MRRLIATVCILAFGLAGSAAASIRDPGDGTLSVRDGRGIFQVAARGGIIGAVAHGRVIITDPDPFDGTVVVTGDDWHRDRTDTTTVYGGTRIRFRVIGGTFKVKVIGLGVNLSVVGQGRAGVKGEGTADDGTYSIDGGDYVPVPANIVTFTLP